MPTEYAKQLYAIAEEQDGYFTAKQAQAAGYSVRMQSYHVANGNWIREARGIFRLAAYPPSPEPELMVWYLWSCNRDGNPQGIYSHATALRVYTLSSWSSDKLHLTVPPGFRRMVVPDVLTLHKKPVDKTDTTTKYGVRVTKPLRTILDVLTDGSVPMKYIEEAISEALDRQLILSGDISHAELTTTERRLLEDLLRRAA